MPGLRGARRTATTTRGGWCAFSADAIRRASAPAILTGQIRCFEACGYAWDVQLVIMLLAAALLLVVLGFVISALKWLLIIAAVLVAVGLLVGWRPGRRSTYH